MIENLSSLAGSDLENTLWNISLSIHIIEYEEQRSFIYYLLNNYEDLEPVILFRTLSNMLHYFFYNMNEEFKTIYIDMLISLNTKKGIIAGDLFEVIGIIIKGCTEDDHGRIVSFIKNNYAKCLTDFSSVISLCNCIRYAYPELNHKNKIILCDILNSLKCDYQGTDIFSSIEFTIRSLEDKDI